MNNTLGAAIVIRNGNELDFSWRECIKSVLPVCDEVVVCDGQSTDGTQEEIRSWMRREPKLKLCVWDWPDPKGDPDFFVRWINYAREHLSTKWHLQLDADEILHEKSHPLVRAFIEQGVQTAICTRYNFWGDHRHLIPEGHCLGKKVIRIAPQRIWLASDGSHPMGAEACMMAKPSGVEIFHYGFLRKRQAFFKKERLLQNYFFNSYDPRLEKAETFKGNWMEMPGLCGDWENKLDPYEGRHPKIIHEWLKERGYATHL
jgi:glycosyltransferase involved in cell wall biosynthesis